VHDKRQRDFYDAPIAGRPRVTGGIPLLQPGLALLVLAVAALGSSAAFERLEVDPVTVTVRGSDATAQIVVTGRTRDDRAVDLTDQVVYDSQDPKVATVDRDGLVHPAGDGETHILVSPGEKVGPVAALESLRVLVRVTDFANTRPVQFAGEVVPIFTKLGCNNGACHGKASGQNGFKLSLLGFDPRADFEALVREARGRRVFPASPDSSLLLLKSSGRAPHGGGQKLEADSAEYRKILRWVRQGMPYDTGNEPKLVAISVTPPQRLIARHSRQQIRVTATYDDGSTADVSRLAQYQTNAADLATVDERGTIETLDGVGEAAIMARFGGQVSVARALVPLGLDVPPWEPPASTNPIDGYVFRKLKELGLPPSGTCTDAEFVRRAAVDICGILPTPDETTAFENDPDPAKRARWVDKLLARPEYADLFAMKWSAILRNRRLPFLGGNAQDGVTFGFHSWIRQSLAENKPFDQFAAEIVAARGDATVTPAVAWYRQSPFNQQTDETEKVDDTAQLFLGMRIQCARCHHHPFEKWSQDDYYGFAAFFSRMGRKAGNDPTSPRVFTMASGTAKNPTNGKAYQPKLLDGPELADLGPRQDPRQALADWLRKPDNPFFARAIVNRYWKHFFGRGLVEPEDDMRVSNPATNPELLDALAADFVASGYDLKHLIRSIATSRAYDRSSLPNEYNGADRQNFARYYPRRLPAEVLLDAINAVTGGDEKFNGLPKGFRAAQLPDDGFASYFLEIFGRPKRESVCECERSSEANLSQTLHLLNSNEIQQKLTAKDTRVARWANDPRPDSEKIDELYRLCYSRPPTSDEREICLAHLAKRQAADQGRQGYEDLLWTLLNTKEFLLNH
jgi:hypothetical protein